MTSWVLRACAVLFAAAMAFASGRGFIENRAFAARGQRAVVDPITSYTTRTTTTTQLGVTVNEQSAKSAELFFRVPEGRRVRIARTLPDEVLAKLSAGTPVEVEYLPEAPEGARFAGYTARVGAPAGIAVVAAALTALLWRRM